MFIKEIKLLRNNNLRTSSKLLSKRLSGIEALQGWQTIRNFPIHMV